MDRLRVAVLPLNISQADKETNLNAVDAALVTLPEGVDIVILPELFSTGFTADVDTMHSLAERNTQQTIDRIRRWASDKSCAFCGTYLASTPPHIYNRAFFIEPNGDETYYDKTHLYGLSSESKTLTPGTSLPPTIRYRGWNVSMVVCYELRFPAWCRNKGCRYDILIIPANWPDSREYAWSHLLMARAIENQAAVVGANRGGSDKFGNYDGMTRFYDAQGKPLSDNVAGGLWHYADFSKSELTEYRHKLPFIDDADDFSISR